MTIRVTSIHHAIPMDGSNYKYRIPAGTTVDAFNQVTGRKLIAYVTRVDLKFIERSGTAYGYSIYEFEHGDWIIKVNASYVEPQGS